jgi:hypothetical protein
MLAAFDRVVINTPTGSRATFSVEQFLELPLAVRIQHILAREVEFYHGPIKVERAEALKSLRR